MGYPCVFLLMNIYCNNIKSSNRKTHFPNSFPMFPWLHHIVWWLNFLCSLHVGFTCSTFLLEFWVSFKIFIFFPFSEIFYIPQYCFRTVLCSCILWVTCIKLRIRSDPFVYEKPICLQHGLPWLKTYIL